MLLLAGKSTPPALPVNIRIKRGSSPTTILADGELGWNRTTKQLYIGDSGANYPVLPATVTTPGGSSGQLQYNNAGAFGGTPAATYAASGNLLTVQAQVATDVPLTVKGAVSQSGNLQQWLDSSNNPLAYISPNGTVWTAQPAATLNNILPTQTGQSGKVLGTNGSAASWVAGGGVSSVSNSDGTLTISPTTGAVIASLNRAHANTWTAAQTFGPGLITSPASGSSGSEIFGSGSGNASISGSANTILGYQGGTALTSGGSNTLIGYKPGPSISTGTENILIGTNAGVGVSGNYNVAVGDSTLGTVATYSNNTCVGDYALAGVTGGGNTALGYAAGQNLGSGTNNVLLGYQADITSVSATGCIALGYQAKAGSNEFAISPYINKITIHGLSSTSGNLTQAVLTPSFINNVNATYTSRFTLAAQDFGGVREAIRMEANGSVATLSFFGATAVVKQSGDIGTALVNYGLITSPTISGAAPGGSSGQLQYNNAGAFGGTAAATYNTSGNLVTIQAQTFSDTPLVVKGAASQSSDLQDWQNTSGNVVASVGPSGAIMSTLSVQVGTSAGNDIVTMFTNRLIYYTTNTQRWQIIKQGSEIGSNAGADLNFIPCSDGGSTLTTALTLRRSTSNVGIKNTAPAYPLDVTGDVNATGVYRVSGVALKELTAQAANTVLAGPTTGAAALPTFRALVSTDFPTSGVAAGSYTNANITVGADGRLTAASSGTGGGGTPGSPVNSVQYNAAGAFAGSANFTYDGIEVVLTAAATTAARAMYVTTNRTGTTGGSLIGFESDALLTGAASVSEFTSIYAQATVSAGHATRVAGIEAWAEVDSPGTADNAYAIYVGGFINDVLNTPYIYGLYVDDQTAISNIDDISYFAWNIYSTGPAARNTFEGPTLIGGSGGNARGSVTNRLEVRSGDDAIKGIVVQANSTTQTANLLEAQDSSGTSVAYVTPNGTFWTNQPAATLNNLLPSQTGHSGQLLQTNGTNASWTGMAPNASRLSRNITQTAHGFTVGQALRLSGSTYVLAQADNVVNAEVVGLVTSVIDANTFMLTIYGYVPGLSGLTAGNVYFLDPATAGAMTGTQPTTSGQINRPLIVADSATSGYLMNYRGVAVP